MYSNLYFILQEKTKVRDCTWACQTVVACTPHTIISEAVFIPTKGINTDFAFLFFMFFNTACK